MKILNFGSCNIDYVYQVPHFVRPGETAACIGLDVGCGGKGLNQSIALALAGGQVYHAGLIGKEGYFLKARMEQAGVDCRFVRQGQGAGGHAIIQVDRSGQNCILLHGGTNQQISTEFVDEVLSFFSEGDILLLQNEINQLPYIIEKAHGRGLRVAFNAAPFSKEVLQYPIDKLTWLVVNEVEGAGFAGTEAPEEILSVLRQRYPKLKVLLTLGAEGSCYSDGEGIIKMPAHRVKAVDTTAAGDTFLGYFLQAMAQNRSSAEALELATAAAAIAVTGVGAADSIPTYDEVKKER